MLLVFILTQLRSWKYVDVVVYQQKGDTDVSRNKMSFGDPNKVNVCFVTSSFLDYGGVERWVEEFIQHIITGEPDFIPLGLYSWELSGQGAWEITRKYNMVMIHNSLELEYCDLIISTGFVSSKTKGQVEILIVHGDHSDEWTVNYAQRSHAYDYIVAVSPSSSLAVSEIDQSRVVYIPSLVSKTQCGITHEPICDKQLLYIGRMSYEKRPDLFCETVCSMDGFCGLMIGPFPDDGSFNCFCGKVKLVGPRHDAQCFIERSLAIVIPSEFEGGPIVAIEAWLHSVPVVMRKTGLARHHPDSFIIFDWDQPDYSHLRATLNDKQLMDSITENSKKALSDHFSQSAILSKWRPILSGVSSTIQRTKSLCDITSDANIRYTGRLIQITCMKVSCEYKIRCTCPVNTTVRIAHFKLVGCLVNGDEFLMIDCGAYVNRAVSMVFGSCSLIME